MMLKRYFNTTSCCILATSLGLLLLASCAFPTFERVDYKAYPTAENTSDFYGRVYAKTRIEAIDIKQVASVEAASQLLGFPVRLPAHLPQGAGPITKIDASQSYTYRVDVNIDLARSLLLDRGFSVETIPDGIEPVQVEAVLQPGALIYLEPEGHFLTFIQALDPQITTLHGADQIALAELNRLGWQYLGLSANEADQISRRMDWASFLALPPADMDTAEFVTIQEQPGVALSSPNNHALLWEKDGVLYGLYSDLPMSELVEVAESLK